VVEEPDDERPLAVIDLDGVVADVRHRLRHVERRPKDWDAFFAAAVDDPPHEEGLAIVRRLAQDHEVVFLTGRPSRTRRATEAWLERHGIGGHRLVMRPRDDRRPAAQVKVRMLRELASGRQVAVVVDDDVDVVAAMRKAGYPTLHATWESRSADGDRALRTAQEAEGRT
jgi:phosphoglycolate phosphatase-like HAD superfamily hydrolase